MGSTLTSVWNTIRPNSIIEFCAYILTGLGIYYFSPFNTARASDYTFKMDKDETGWGTYLPYLLVGGLALLLSGSGIPLVHKMIEIIENRASTTNSSSRAAKRITKSESESNTILIVCAVGAAVFLLVLIGLYYCYYIQSQSDSPRGDIEMGYGRARRFSVRGHHFRNPAANA